jgi:hypothetical protein
MDTNRQTSPRFARRLVIALAAVIFISAIVQSTAFLYSRTSDAYFLRPDNILAGRSEAPNQYRVLVPLLNGLLWRAGHLDAEKSDRLVILASIVLCYLAAGALFLKSSGSVPAAMLALVALLGSFAFGMTWRYRQEFFDVAFVSLFFLILIAGRPKGWTYVLLAVITALGALNRETFGFCITGMVAHLWSKREGTGKGSALLDAAGVLVLSVIFAVVFVGVRRHFGLASYQGGIWTFHGNELNLRTVLEPHDALYMGSGLLLVYLTTLALGNREYLAFILGYGIPMLLVAFFISRYNEHRIFYPLMVFLIASIIRFLTRREPAADRQ